MLFICVSQVLLSVFNPLHHLGLLSSVVCIISVLILTTVPQGNAQMRPPTNLRLPRKRHMRPWVTVYFLPSYINLLDKQYVIIWVWKYDIADQGKTRLKSSNHSNILYNAEQCDNFYIIEILCSSQINNQTADLKMVIKCHIIY